MPFIYIQVLKEFYTISYLNITKLLNNICIIKTSVTILFITCKFTHTQTHRLGQCVVQGPYEVQAVTRHSAYYCLFPA